MGGERKGNRKRMCMYQFLKTNGHCKYGKHVLIKFKKELIKYTVPRSGVHQTLAFVSISVVCVNDFQSSYANFLTDCLDGKVCAKV